MRRSLTFIRFLGLLLASEIALLDQWSKAVVIGLAEQGRIPIEITSFFNIVLTANRGISFGMLRHSEEWMPLLLTLATSAVTIGLTVWMLRATERSVILGLGLIVGGAVGNIIDRAALGAVTDFLDFHVGGYHWPAFNLADSTIFVGVVLLFFGSIVKRPSEGAPDASPVTETVERPDNAQP